MKCSCEKNAKIISLWDKKCRLPGGGPGQAVCVVFLYSYVVSLIVEAKNQGGDQR